MSDTSAPRRTPLYDEHRAAGGRIVDFHGWEMPVQYSGILAEHRAVRSQAGLFDVSHMGQVEMRGADAESELSRITCNDPAQLADGQAQYSALTTEKGTLVDDIVAYRLASDRFLLCINAANRSKDYEWIRSQVSGRVEVLQQSDDFAQLALQGPAAVGILGPLCEEHDLAALDPFAFVETHVSGVAALVSRTGYTGEDGYELYCAPDDAPALWRRLIEVGGEAGLVPVGLGARDTLRLESRLLLYGSDMDETTTALEAGLGFIVKLDKGDFLGRDALARQKSEGLTRRLMGVALRGAGVARAGYTVLLDGEPVGPLTSGGVSPTLDTSIGLVYMPKPRVKVGQPVEIEIRNRKVAAEVVKTPFYRRKS